MYCPAICRLPEIQPQHSLLDHQFITRQFVQLPKWIINKPIISDYCAAYFHIYIWYMPLTKQWQVICYGLRSKWELARQFAIVRRSQRKILQAECRQVRRRHSFNWQPTTIFHYDFYRMHDAWCRPTNCSRCLALHTRTQNQHLYGQFRLGANNEESPVWVAQIAVNGIL